MELVADLRCKATSVFAGTRDGAQQASLRLQGLAAGLVSSLGEGAVLCKAAASRLVEPAATRFADAVTAVRSVRAAAVARTLQMSAAASSWASSAQLLVEKVQGDVKSKGLRSWTEEAAAGVRQVAGETVASGKVRAREGLQQAGSQALAEVQLVQGRAKEAKDSACVKAQELRAASGNLVSRAGALGLAEVELVREQASQAKESVSVKAQEVYAASEEFLSQKSVQTAAASAASGGMVLGAGGAAVGAVSGGLAGAMAGLPLAVLTLGLSIPLGAVVGGGAGLAVGSAAGATTGVLGGGAAGYGAYQKKEDISELGSSALAKASSGVELVKGQLFTTSAYARERVSAATARLGGQTA